MLSGLILRQMVTIVDNSVLDMFQINRCLYLKVMHLNWIYLRQLLLVKKSSAKRAGYMGRTWSAVGSKWLNELEIV